MDNPAYKKGFTQIDNELLEALAKIRISGQATQVLNVILRKTDGFHKRQDAISLSQFVLATGLSKVAVCKAVEKLCHMNLITKKGNKVANLYFINKDFATWKPLPKKVTLPKKETPITNKGKKRYPKSNPQKIVTKETLTKETSDVPSREITILFNEFKNTVNPHLNFANKTERRAAADLIGRYGLDNIIDAVRFTAAAQGSDPYMPKITSPYDLWVKWAKLKLHFESKQGGRRKIWTNT